MVKSVFWLPWVVFAAGGCRIASEPTSGIYDPAQLDSYTVAELLGFFTAESIIPHSNMGYDDTYLGDIECELIRRKPIEDLLYAFDHPRDGIQRSHVLNALYHIDDDRITATFETHMTKEATEATYYCVNYLAKRGDRRALAILNDNYGRYPVSSWQWSYSMELFGIFRYRPAVPNLSNSLNDASLNVTSVAEWSLKEIAKDR